MELHSISSLPNSSFPVLVEPWLSEFNFYTEWIVSSWNVFISLIWELRWNLSCVFALLKRVKFGIPSRLIHQRTPNKPYLNLWLFVTLADMFVHLHDNKDRPNPMNFCSKLAYKSRNIIGLLSLFWSFTRWQGNDCITSQTLNFGCFNLAIFR